jgi:precorrin-6A/cobalt-precorrin-6A reductase
MRRVLILGGTAEGRALAQDLSDLPVISSLAGRVARPRLPVGEVRIGGFGGPQALARWLAEQGIAAVVDATHPFAERISASAEQASATSGVPLLRLERPGWQAGPGDRWHWVDDLPEASAALDALDARRVFLTTGRQGLSAFAADDLRWYLIRCVDPPQVALPGNHEVVLDRGPYTLDGELRLLDAHAIDIVVTKDSGGELTVAKLEAARARRLPVIVVRRPPRGAVTTVPTVEAAAAWARRQASG